MRKGLITQAFFIEMTKDNWEIKLARLLCITAFIHGCLYLVGSMRVFMPPVPIDFTITLLFSVILFRTKDLKAFIGSAISLIITFSLFSFYARDQWVSSIFFDEKSIVRWEEKSDLFSFIFSLACLSLFVYYFILAKEIKTKVFVSINAALLVFLILMKQSPFYAIIPTPLIFMSTIFQDKQDKKNEILPALSFSVVSCFILFRYLLLLSHKA